MNISIFNSRLTYVSNALLLILFTQPSSANGIAFDEIIVTANKYEQPARDVGAGLTVFSNKQLWEHQVNEVGDLAKHLPNVVQSFSDNLASYNIRGIGMTEFAGNFDTPVAVHFDEVYFGKSYMSSMGLFDIQRVEALKGPQGTLFGRNTIGGAVNYYTQTPTNNRSSSLALGYGSHDRFRAEGFVNAPIVGDILGRVSLSTSLSSGGPYDNLFTGEEIGSQDKIGVRGQLAWANQQTKIRALVHYGHNKSELTPFETPGTQVLGSPGVPCPQFLNGQVQDNQSACARFGGIAPTPANEFEDNDPFTVNQDYFSTAKNEAIGGYFRVEHDMNGHTLTSISAYEYFERDEREDSDATTVSSINIDWYNEINQYSQELRLNGSIKDKWRYVLGGFYQHDDITVIESALFASNPFLVPVFPAGTTRSATDFKQTLDSFAAFLHNEFDLTDTTTIIAGLRYTVDETDITGQTFFGNGAAGKEDNVTPVIIVDSRNDLERRDTNLSYKFGGEWRPNSNALIYANVSTGYRSGGFGAAFGETITSFNKEEILAYEGGAKLNFLDDRLRWNVGLFCYDYQDAQINVDVPNNVVPITTNAGNIEAIGFESDIWFTPAEEWTLYAGIGYLDAEINVSDFNIRGISLKGKRPVNAPEWSFNASLRYKKPITSRLNLLLVSDFSWTDDRFYEVTNLPATQIDSYHLLNARASLLTQDKKWELSLWARNITDSEYLVYINDVFPLTLLNIYGEPRTFGATLSYRYE